MRCKWYFRNKPSDNFSEVLAFKPKSLWMPPAAQPSVDLILSKLEEVLFSFLPSRLQTYNLCNEEWQEIRNFAEDCSSIIKPADKVFCAFV